MSFEELEAHSLAKQNKIFLTYQHRHTLRSIAPLMILWQQLELGTRRIIKALEVLPFVVLVAGTQNKVPAVITFQTKISRLCLHQPNAISNLLPFPAKVLLIGIAVGCDDKVILFALVVAAHDTEIIAPRGPLDAGLIV